MRAARSEVRSEKTAAKAVERRRRRRGGGAVGILAKAIFPGDEGSISAGVGRHGWREERKWVSRSLEK